jgi:hypothetical protein
MLQSRNGENREARMNGHFDDRTVAVVQHPPVLLDHGATVARGRPVDEAAEAGA